MKPLQNRQIKENDIVKGILDYLHIIKIYSWRNNTRALNLPRGNGKMGLYFFGKKGSSDILGILPNGRFLAIECKRRGGKLSPAQDEFIGRIRENGGLAILAYSLDDVIRELKWKN